MGGTLSERRTLTLIKRSIASGASRCTWLLHAGEPSATAPISHLHTLKGTTKHVSTHDRADPARAQFLAFRQQSAAGRRRLDRTSHRPGSDHVCVCVCVCVGGEGEGGAPDPLLYLAPHAAAARRRLAPPPRAPRRRRRRRRAQAVGAAEWRAWCALEGQLAGHHAALAARAGAAARVAGLRAQNGELRALLGQYLASDVHASLVVPPTALV